MKKLFGTDGMRGEAGKFPLDAETVSDAGRSLARHLAASLGRAPRIVTGRDTRESGAWIEDAFAAGARAGGAACESAGVVTTPGVAYLARTLPADAGVVVSASHNPYNDNGIKIFAPTGRKLDDATERLIEADIHAARAARRPPTDAAPPPADDETDDETAATSPSATSSSATLSSTSATHSSATTSSNVPRGASDDAGAEADGGRAAELRRRYLHFLVEEVAAGLRLDGLKIVIDCAHGAASQFAPELFRRLGAQVVAVGDAPDGRNINRDAGSLHLEGLCRKVVEEGASFGAAFDGDADRALFADARGRVVDGDATLWVLAGRMSERGELAGGRVVATVMSNIGLEIALRSRGLELLRTDVGDKYVLEELLRTGASLGGEQSGHVIFPRVSLAGDGMITTVLMLRALRETGRELHELTEGFVRYPQVLLNVRVREKLPFGEVAEIARAAREVEEELGASGRLLLRYSGTEALARVMIEGESQAGIERLAGGLAAVIGRSLGVDEPGGEGR